MKLQQLRFLAAVAQNDLNITAAASKLCTTQPAVSKQLRLLEDELGFNIFVRSGRTLAKITPPGERVVQCAMRILREAANIKGVSAEFKDENKGTLSIGTTHTQARYVLPAVIREFRARYPNVQFHLHQGTSEQIAEMAQTNRIDLAIATGATNLFNHYVLLPCYRWNRRIIVPRDASAGEDREADAEAARGVPDRHLRFSFTGPSSLNDIFAAAGLRPDIALTARDADVIKTYGSPGLGVGIIADMALDRTAGCGPRLHRRFTPLPRAHDLDRLRARHAAETLHLRLSEPAGAASHAQDGGSGERRAHAGRSGRAVQ